MTFGRAVMIGRIHRTPLPDLIDDESVENGVSIQPPSTFPSLALFVQSFKLFETLHDVLDLLNTCRFGSHNDDARWEDLIIQILTINRQLELFYDGLAIDLRVGVSSVPPATPSLHLQQQVLYCR